MRIMIVVSDIAVPLRPTTAMIAAALDAREHEVTVASLTNLTLDDNGARIRGREAGADDRTIRMLGLAEQDLLWLRVNPGRPSTPDWARAAVLDLGFVAETLGIPVVNPPAAIARALTKSYLMRLPEHVRHGTLVSSDREELLRTCESLRVIKPAMGTGGTGVFVADPTDPNVPSLIDSLLSTGPVVSQPLIPQIVTGVDRITLWEGTPLRVEGRIAAVRRTELYGVPKRLASEAVDTVLEDSPDLARLYRGVGRQAVADGIVHAGTDSAGDTLFEMNVWAPGGLAELQELTGMDFAAGLAERAEDWAIRRRDALATGR